tara:strand:+ start:223 stop:666 length:444 start_codon:yes stop_codon:yes gene_type:complete
MKVEAHKTYTLNPVEETKLVYCRLFTDSDGGTVDLRETVKDFQIYVNVCNQKDADILNLGIDCDEEYETDISNLQDGFTYDFKEQCEYDIDIELSDVTKEDIISDIESNPDRDIEELLDLFKLQPAGPQFIKIVGPIEINYIKDMRS